MSGGDTVPPTAGTGEAAGTAGPTVVYIGGAGRSGSTLLERLLGAVPGVVALGEVVHLPVRGLVEGQACACGAPFPACPFWSEVGRVAFGGWDRVDGQEWAALQHRVDRNRHLPRLARPVGRRFRRDLDEHLDRVQAVYRAAAEVSGARVLVDSSKHVSTAFALRRARDVSVRFVHLVRDSRGVAFSWTKEVARPEAAGEKMPQYSPVASAAWWDAFNAMLLALRATGTTVLRLRYEDLVDDPAPALRAVLEPTGLALAGGWDAFLTPGAARLGPSHSVAGNPMRFATGTVPLRRDDRWRHELPARDRRTVTALTAPFLAAYGYAGRRGAAPGVHAEDPIGR